MRFFSRKKKVKLQIDFDKDSGDIQVICDPASTRPTEAIQILMFSIETINNALQQELSKEKKSDKGKRKKSTYIS